MEASYYEFGSLPSSEIFWKSLSRIGVSSSLNRKSMKWNIDMGKHRPNNCKPTALSVWYIHIGLFLVTSCPSLENCSQSHSYGPQGMGVFWTRSDTSPSHRSEH